MATEEQIRNYAHLLWEKAGRPESRAEEFWHAAEVELNSESESPDAPTEETSGDETKRPTPNEQASKLTRGDQSQLPTVTTLANTTESPAGWADFHPIVASIFEWWRMALQLHTSYGPTRCWWLWYSSSVDCVAPEIDAPDL